MKYKIKEIGTVVTGATPKTKNDNYYNSKDFLFIGPTDLKKEKYVIESEKHISKDAYNDYKSRFIEKDSIMIDCIGSDMGNVALSKNKVLTNQQINSITNINKNLFNIEYTYYLLSTMKKYFHQIGTNGSTMPIINKSMFEEIELELPDKSIQDKVVKILSKIDEKIELNVHTNNNLYKTFRSIYKNTFLNKTTNTIKFSDFNEIGSLVMGQSPKGSSYNEEKIGLPLINGAADYKDGMLNPNKYTSEPTRVCNAKDLVFCIRATIGQLTIADQEYCLGRGVACISNINELYYEYVFNIIEESIDKLKAVATGSVILGLSKDDINNLEVYKPTLEEIEKFHIIEQPILNRIIEIKKQNKTLEQIRDTLLPKLMNGEIDLDKIEI